MKGGQQGVDGETQVRIQCLGSSGVFAGLEPRELTELETDRQGHPQQQVLGQRIGHPGRMCRGRRGPEREHRAPTFQKNAGEREA